MRLLTTGILALGLLLVNNHVLMAEENMTMKVMGRWDWVFGWAENTKFAKSSKYEAYGRGKGSNSRDKDSYKAAQRLRTQVNFITSKTLQGILMFEIGNINWGYDRNHKKSGQSSGGDLGADGVNIEAKRAYLDWMVPETDLAIRMGLQGLSLPMATKLGSPIIDEDVAALVASYAINDTFSITGFWSRPYNYNLKDNDERSRHLDDEMDMFGLVVPINLDGITITPWGVWANIGSASGFYERMLGVSRSNLTFEQNDHATGWWVGTGIAVNMFDPLTFALDIMNGGVNNNHIIFSGNNEFVGLNNGDEWSTKGWFIVANLNCKLDWGTPGLFGWWTSGDSTEGINAGQFGRMPLLAPSGFAPTSFGFDGEFAIADGYVISSGGAGTWGAGIQLANVSFIDKLSHTVRFAYYSGTNESNVVKKYKRSFPYELYDSMYLTDKDNVFEINFDHKYKIYENLTGVLGLAYIHLDLDKATWHGVNDSNEYHKTNDAWKAQMSFQYNF